ncbi:SRPBCC family protein [Diaphorobacter aerolatus]|uniref:SRPBCC family protein n=1 Tax=Diaphorobacter aerolatus TaxID=1288495 RepID=A0A7H0GQG3_9BURK|nr:SRPBCC family protein [Diaphorobacter aerolatus]
MVLTRLIDAPADKLFRCWTEPELLVKWFVPAPWSVARAEVDLRPGGRCLVVMRSPEGQEMPNDGVYLEVVPNRRLVFTDAYRAGWIPSEKPFMTAIVSFEPEGSGTRYTAIARHWNAQDRKTHEDMGFHEGWGICASQMEALAKTL